MTNYSPGSPGRTADAVYRRTNASAPKPVPIVG
jgi:hypothetical protein